LLSANTIATYILSAHTSTTIIITLEPCALNAEFQHFILRFNKNFVILRVSLKEEEIGGGSRKDVGVKEGVTLGITLLFLLLF
jgi:hypothetical protein